MMEVSNKIYTGCIHSDGCVNARIRQTATKQLTKNISNVLALRGKREKNLAVSVLIDEPNIALFTNRPRNIEGIGRMDECNM